VTAPRILVVGGYGVVGEQIARLLAARNPEAELWIGGRSIEIAAALAGQIPGSRGVRIDVDEADPLSALPEQPGLVVAAANDSEDRLLLAAARRGIAYVDITRWTPRLHRAIERLSAVEMSAPAVMASGWMAGVAATVAARAAQDFSRIDMIEIDILYALKDKAGPNSVEYADQLAVPFTIWSGGKPRIVKPLTDPKPVRFSGERTLECYRFDTPDQFTLVHALGAAGASSRLTYDDQNAAKFMRLLMASGIWSLLSLPLFRRVRRAILYNPGEGAPHEVSIRVSGQALDGSAKESRLSVIDPFSQTHMTAAGAVMQSERILGLRGRARPGPGVSFPEQAADLETGIAALREMGIRIESAS